MLSIAHSEEKIYRFDVHLGLNETIDQLAMENSVC